MERAQGMVSGAEYLLRSSLNFISFSLFSCIFGVVHLYFAADMVKMFGVDAIPHVAFITNKAEVQTALVGAVPKKIMTEEVSALVLVSNVGMPSLYEWRMLTLNYSLLTLILCDPQI